MRNHHEMIKILKVYTKMTRQTIYLKKTEQSFGSIHPVMTSDRPLYRSLYINF